MATTDPIGSFESFINGETEIFTVVDFPLHANKTWLSDMVTDSSSHLVMSCVMYSFDSNTYS